MSEAWLDRLAERAGILDRFIDLDGVEQRPSDRAKRAVLSAMGFDAADEDAARVSLERIERAAASRIAPPTIVVEADKPARVALTLPRGTRRVRWSVQPEGHARRRGDAVRGDGDIVHATLGTLPAGYHSLTVEAGGRTEESFLIAAPETCWVPPEAGAGARLWGLTAQVYGLASSRNLGIGDFEDIGTLIDIAGAHEADVLGVSPLHAGFAADPGKFSPYGPSSRLFLNTLFLAVEKIDGFAECAQAHALLQEAGFRSRIEAARRAELVDYVEVSRLKLELFEALFGSFDPTSEAFAEFRRVQGQDLQRHALFETLSEHFAGNGLMWLGAWPEDYRHLESPAVAEFAAANSRRIAYHAWLQWQAAKQMDLLGTRATSAGLAAGLYKDLAVGGDPYGSEVWCNGALYARNVSIGAPPDALAPQGQVWGLPPLNPHAPGANRHELFRSLVSANMRGAGAIRIDHAFQLRRLFWVPEGIPASEGAYVLYPLEELIAILKVESQRARCMVIAEDLGTVPPGFPERIMQAGILSYRLFFFEREADGAFRAPEAYPRRAMAAISTHDLPTLSGWWRGHDLEMRERIGILRDPEVAAGQREGRVRDRKLLAGALARQGLLEEALADTAEDAPLSAVVALLARTPSMLTAVQLEDVIGEVEQANVPGTSNEHPNWQRKLSLDLDEIAASQRLEAVERVMAEQGRGARPGRRLALPAPGATYRLQLHKDFTFDDAAAIVPYLARLGISHIYTSPILAARPGSQHGYDIVDHTHISPELGGEDGLSRLHQACFAQGMSMLVDIVPNHMGVGGADNPWWLKVLEWGPLVAEARYFDIDWDREGIDRGKVVLPFLADQYGIVLERGELPCKFDPVEGSFSVWHYEHRFPICPLHYPLILERAIAALATDALAREPVRRLIELAECLRRMDADTAPERRAGFPAEAEAIKAAIAAAAQDEAVREGVERAVVGLNGIDGVPDSFGTLHRLLELQAYRLAYWRVASTDINYRRFFDINTLAGLRMEEPELFERAHAKTFELVRAGVISGLRIDHIDGLADPDGYLRDLQRALGPGFYVVVEKILEGDERLRAGWLMAGTTGYETMNLINGVFVDPGSRQVIGRIYRQFAGDVGDVHAGLAQAKREILEYSLSSELEVLAGDLDRIANADRRTRDYTYDLLRRVLREVITLFPVYRSYVGTGEPSEEDRRLIGETVGRARAASRLPDRSIYDFVQAVLLNDIDTEAPGRPETGLCARFRTRFQQLTGPVMAKGLEDTLFYRQFPLLSLNEVGAEPGQFGIAPDHFHAANLERARAWPHALVATATHDMKRGEDVRARLDVLSELPTDWAAQASRFRRIARGRGAEGGPPDGNDLYLILQSIIGAWPIEALEAPDGAMLAAYRDRIEAYVLKALREAKRHSSWVNANERYEQATLDVVRRLLDPSRRNRFVQAALPFANRVAHLGMLNGLAQMVLKCTVPGVPDTYQGADGWDLSLVDPDNRRPVDYVARSAALDDASPLPSLLASWRDGRVKTRLLATLLSHRREHPELYARGDYRGLVPSGELAGSVLAFERRHGAEQILVVVPRLLARRLEHGALPLAGFWGDTSVGHVETGRWHAVLTGGEIYVGADGRLDLAAALSDFPAAVLMREE